MSRFHAPIAEQIWDMKYRYKNNTGEPIDETVEATWERIAHALSQPEPMQTSEQRLGRKKHRMDFYDALEDFKYVPAGRIVAGAGTGRAVTLFNCFVMGTIPDSMDGIFSMLREAALTMQQGGGIGYDFSPIRPKGALVKKLGADASGPLTFMDCWDSMCRTVMSAGSRRGAMMATMRCDHPDIMDFITAKNDPARLRMFNMSVLATDAFMKAVKEDEDWELRHIEPPQKKHMKRKKGETTYVYETVKARDLWDAMMKNTYNAAEPGVIFIDRINRANNLNYCEEIAATNPCGEQPLPPYGACLLGSINLASLVENAFQSNAGIDVRELSRLVATAVRMMDNVVDVSNFPLESQRLEAEAKRRIGLGVTGLASALAMCGIRYGSDDAVERTANWMRLIDHSAYAASIELAKEKGAFPLFDADKYLAPGTHAATLPLDMQAEIRKSGIRNALLTSIAPTGTISLYAGNVSSGIEPIFAYSYTRKVLQPDGSKTEELVEDYAVAAYREFWNNVEVFSDDPEEGAADHVMEFNPDTDLPDYFVNAQTLTPMDHVRMQAVAQKHVDSSISKTINVPEDIDFESFKDVYMEAYDSGCKGCTTYRPNDITGSVLSVDEKPKEEPTDPDKAQLAALGAGDTLGITAEMETGPGRNYPPHLPNDITVSFKEELPDRPEELEGSTYKIKVGDQKAVYLTINDTVESDGTVRPFEIFLRSSDPAHDEWMVALARMISAIMRRPHDASFVGAELLRVTSATTAGFQRGYGFRPSLVAAIGAKIKEHADRCSLMKASEKWEIGLPELDDEVPDFPPENLAWADFPVGAAGSDFGGHVPVPKHSCKDCGSYNLKHEAGCEQCLDCGSSKCG